MKEKYKAFKEWRKNPRYNALFKLLCWFIFFATLYLLACAGVFAPKYKSSSKDSNNGRVTNDSVENYINMSSYEYEYNIKYDDNTVNINGIFYDNKYYFSIEDKNYYDNGTLYFVDEDKKQLIEITDIDLPISLNEIERNIIHMWLDEGEIYETIAYKDGSKIVTYLYSPTDEYDIKVVATESEHLINYVEIDLLELFQTKNIEYNNFNVNIKYTNINNISSYEKNYEKDYEIIALEDEPVLEEQDDITGVTVEEVN